jgi:hypothetical protein
MLMYYFKNINYLYIFCILLTVLNIFSKDTIIRSMTININNIINNISQKEYKIIFKIEINNYYICQCGNYMTNIDT